MTKKDQIIKLRAEGKSYREITDIVDCDQSYVAQALARHRCGGSTPRDQRYEAKRPPRDRRASLKAYRERQRREASGLSAPEASTSLSLTERR